MQVPDEVLRGDPVAERAAAPHLGPAGPRSPASRGSCYPTARLHTINTTRKATVAYPTVKCLLLHIFYATHLQKLMKSLEMV